MIKFYEFPLNRKNDLILIMAPEKQDKTLELSKHWSVDSTPARNEVIIFDQLLSANPISKLNKIHFLFQLINYVGAIVYGPTAVRSMRHKHQNKYFPFEP